MREDFERYAGEIEAGLRADRAREARPELGATDGRELQERELPPIREPVPGLIVQGLTILGAPPKYGKSWLVLELCLAVAGGERFLGFATNRCACLYLALEDSQRRLRDRMNRVLHGARSPEGFFCATRALTTDTGLTEQLEGFLEEHPDTGVVVIDTLQKVRGSSFGRDGSYAADYREMGLLKSFADRHRLALILVHHLRKLGDETDPFNRLSGTAAITGAADTMIVLSRDRRGADTTRLNASGRDIEELELELQFRKDRCRWLSLGSPEDLASKRALEEYEASPIVRTIRKLVEQSPGREWTGTATQLMEAGQYITGHYLAPSAKALGKRLGELEKPLLEEDGISHMTVSHGTGGKRHVFRNITAVSLHEAKDQQEIPF